jgi:WD40 repeat protein
MGTNREIKDFNPFPGLRPFAPEDSELFFGRDAECDEVILKLLKNRFVTLIGPSGIGKTSLVFGGIIPKIKNLKSNESGLWNIISFRPGNTPFENLAHAISKGISDQGKNSIGSDIILSELYNHNSLPVVVRNHLINNNENVLLVIDQFEELFRYPSPGKSEVSYETVNKFIDFLVESVVKPDLNLFIIVTIRSEYLGDCSRYKVLTKLVNDSNFLVPDVGIDNYREIIERPVEYAGAGIDPELVDVLVEDIGASPNQPLVLQHTLMSTWAQWRESGDHASPISISDYNSAGTKSNALSFQAEKVYDELNERGKEICSVMFKTITRKSADIKGSRHPVDVGTIKLIAGCSDEELLVVLRKFRSPSLPLITLDAEGEISDNSVVDLRNECLIRLWPRLKDWVDSEAASVEMYLRLSEASALYQQGKAGLCRPPDLQMAINWRNRNKPTLNWAIQYDLAFERAIVYLRTSERAFLIEEKNRISLQNIKTKRNRFITRILGLAVLVAAGFWLSEHNQKLSSERLAILADQKRNQAVKEKIVADSSATVALKLKAVSDSVSKVTIREAEEFRKQNIVADIQKSFAEKNADEAIHQKDLAIEQRNIAQRLRMISIGKSMSLKSLQMPGQKDLQTLLAYQAYLFNKKNNGLDNDPDIYEGLYNVALQYGNVNCKSFSGYSGEIKSIAFLPGKREFFTSGNDGRVLKWSLDRRDQSLQVIYSGSDIIDVLAVSPDASWLACGSSNSSIRMIPLRGNDIGYEMNGHKGGIKSLIYSYDGKYLYSAALDGKVLKWDIAARTSINVSTGLMEISAIDISSKGNYLAGVSNDGNVVVWNPDKNTDNFRIETAGKNIKVVRFNPENNLLAIGDADGNVELWDINLRKKVSSVKAHGGQVSDIQFNTILKQMATAGEDKKLRIFNIKDPSDLTEPPVSLADNVGFVLVMQFSPDGQMIVSGESGGGNKLIGRPSHVDYFVSDICRIVSRNMTQEEWNVYVGKDIPLEETCQNNKFNIKVEPIISLNK